MSFAVHVVPHRFVVGVGLVVATALGSACQAAAPAPKPTAAPTVASVRPLKVGVAGGVNSASLPIFYASESGLFKQRGLEPSVQVVSNDTLGMQGLLSGEFDVLFTGASPTIVAAGSGAAVKIVVSPSPTLDYFFVGQKGINGLKDMEGKSLAVSAPGAQSALVPITLLKEAGVDIDKVNVVAVGADAARGRALIGKSVDASVLNTMVTVQTTKEAPDLHVLANAGADFSERFFANALVARSETVENQAPLLQDAVIALIEAARVLQSDKTKFVTFARAQPGLPGDAVDGAYDLLTRSPKPWYGVDGGLDQKAFDATVESLLANGQLKARVTFDTLVPRRFVDEMLKQLGPYKKA